MYTYVFNFKDPATVYAYSLISVHHGAMWYLIVILSLVYWCLFRIVSDSNWFTSSKHLSYFYIFFSRFFFFLDFLVISIFFFILTPFSNFSDLRRHSTDSFFFNFFKGWEHFVGYNSCSTLQLVLSYDNIIMLNFEKYSYYSLTNWLNVAYRFYNSFDYFDRNLFAVLKFNHSTLFEFICAVIPTCIILSILIPSTLLLYSLDEEVEPVITFKVIGHQWFWSYEFNNWLKVNDEWRKVSYNFDSCMVTEDDLTVGDKRLLEVDKPLFVPVNVPLRFLITSVDVLHAWTVPELGIKIDAVPGRLSHYLVLVRRPGVFYGQCSELCGVAHGFMPIVIKAV